VASKLGVKVAHIEAGLRSFDRSMPEEINRIVTDHLSDLLFTTEPSGNENLQKEGIPMEKIHFVGNTMIDTLVRLLPKAEARWPVLKQQLGLEKYALVTLHRPSNVDDPETLQEIMTALLQISRQLPVLFPVHPRTRQRIANLGLDLADSNLLLTEPMGYLDFLSLQMHASMVMTDSGGVQEETTYLGTPCLTLRPNTERPITLAEGTNRLVSSEYHQSVLAVFQQVLHATHTSQQPPKYWDGMTARRILHLLSEVA